MNLCNALIKQTDAYEKFGHDAYFRIYVLCVHPTYQTKGVGTALLKNCVRVATTLNMPAIGGIFTSGLSQTMAANQGFEILSEIRYSRWIINDEVIFDDPGRGNYSAAFMGMLLPAEET
ncbi:hypothetical protein KM043_012517 [Ampulex compressa]|nr:hypothetical protein KM043_012517 [Ampulex compressa]